MARFPRTEPEIAALAEAMITGLTDNSAIYPAPPIAPLDLTTAKNAYIIALNAAIAAAAAAEAATATKDDALEELIDAMKSDIRYAENTVNFDDDKLKLIGWAGKKAPTALTPPGQTRLLEAPRQGNGWVFLDWKAPIDGGAPNAYKVTRRERPDGTWAEVATAVISEATLVEQPKGKELEYRIIAINKAGDGSPSNTAMVVL
ncbi:MAG: fibronectin type III domain-containing protein [Planctomycetes bacterium]|nr:fibronectin type III domain-containing protein [Planctomycetota bacterium]